VIVRYVKYIHVLESVMKFQDSVQEQAC